VDPGVKDPSGKRMPVEHLADDAYVAVATGRNLLVTAPR
jgi:hypothetical protein